jgi:HD-GYP domain-containing protein (c-di-GMP phosphodiesterase class II)
MGKIFVDNGVLRSSDFGPEEMAAMLDHPRAGQELLAPFHLFTSFIAGMHHTFQENPYGMNLDDMAPNLGESAKKLIVQVAQLVAECDFYDALTTRPARAREDTSSTAALRDLLSDRVSTARVEWLLANDMVTARN